MPKIGQTESVFVLGERKRFTIFYSQKRGFYLKDFPQKIIDVTDAHMYSIHTEGELAVWLRNTLNKYHALVKKQRKVIVYHIGCTTEALMHKESPGHYIGTQSWLPRDAKVKLGQLQMVDGFRAPGMGIAVSHEVLMEVQGEQTVYYDIDGGGNITGHGVRKRETHNLLIDWSEEAENWFIALEAAIHELVKRIASPLLFPENVQQIISNNTVLLSHNKEEEL